MSSTRKQPELLAPAGDWECARAAVENGADAIYFGLQGGFNARARAANFTPDELPKLMTFLRSRGVKGYLTLNTLVFSDEFEDVERTVRHAAASGVDAVLVQDLGLLRLIRKICPELPLHASTQMTLSSAECIAEAALLGIERVVLPRELSIEQIAAIHAQTSIELEVFVHGALCISYSGQCLASLCMGGRSANRGQCAQPCRLPYDIFPSSTDQGRAGEWEKSIDSKFALNVTPYPLSPHDLAAYDRLSALAEAGVAAFKIEGRLKPPEYVASVTRNYRAAIDAIYHGEAVVSQEDVAEMEMSFSRGFCHGWLDGDNHQALISGATSNKRGTLLGEVCGVRGERIVVELAAPVRRGDGVAFEKQANDDAEQGGRIYEVFQKGRSLETEVQCGPVELAFRYGSIDRSKISLGQKIWKTDDPQAARRLRKSFTGTRRQRRVALDLIVEASVGQPMQVYAKTATGATCQLESADAMVEAQKHPLTLETLREQFGRLGNTPYELRQLDATIKGRPMLPLSVLGKLRHALIERLDAIVAQPPQRTIAEGSCLAALRAECQPATCQDRPVASKLHVLCRSLEQVEAVLGCGVSSVLVELRDLGEYADAVRRIRDSNAQATLASPRIHRPGESGVFEQLAACKPDAVLARNLAALGYFHRLGMPVIADFLFNAVNEFACDWLWQIGALRVTAAYDLSPQRLIKLAATVPPERIEVIVHGHPPLFHTEHCLFCRAFSEGKNRLTCGQPCRRHGLWLHDRRGVAHWVTPDSQCRNTVFHGEASSAISQISQLRTLGVRHFRVELLNERSQAEVRRTLAAVALSLEIS